MNYFNAVKELVGGALSGPTFGPVTEFIFNDGQTPPTEEEIQTKLSEMINAEPMRLLREERNRRLTETDWTQYRDVTLSNDSDWQTYRQSLRDLPSTSSPKLDDNGQLSNVTWPTEPE
tara:strand:+ start:803 stop:1156 length:354 start_codon:yes stop_codon:yes gene_type:complete